MTVHFLSHLDLERTRSGLQQVFPEFGNIGALQIIGDGFSSYVILVSGVVIFRIAKQAEAMQRHQKERSILPRLASILMIQVPQPEWAAGPSPYFPFGLIGYRIIPGVPFSLDLIPQVNLAQVTQDVARFLFDLHRFPLEAARALGIPETEDPLSIWTEMAPALARYLSRADFIKISAWWEAHQGYLSSAGFSPRLIHADPWAENLILNPQRNRLVGVVDFESAAIGDIAQDFSALKYLGQDPLKSTLEHYQALGGELGNHFSERYQAHALLRELNGLRYALRYPEAGELEDALLKIQNELHSNSI